MKDVKVTIRDAKNILAATKIDPNEAENILSALEVAAKNATPWWVIVLKTLAYLIGLLLAGYGTTAAAQTCLTIM